MKTTLTQEKINQIIAFHGHCCPGLAIGIRAGEWALLELGHATDEEIVTITETDMCGVDAIQFLIGCTFGKGNLIFRDYGKVAFSFYRRSDNKKLRLLLNRNLTADLRKKQESLDPKDKNVQQKLRQLMIERILNADMDQVFTFCEPTMEIPQKAKMMKSIPCSSCGEEVMESRLKQNGDVLFCVPCSEHRNPEKAKA